MGNSLQIPSSTSVCGFTKSLDLVSNSLGRADINIF